MPASSLDIVLPCYNPPQGWDEKIILQFKELCKRLPSVQLRIILVNDGSSVGVTEEQISKIRSTIHFFKYISYPVNKGKGYALREGVKASDAEIIIYTDVDFPFTIDSILKIWEALYENETDVAAGVLNKTYYKQVPGGRKLISRVLRGMTTTLLRTKISDTQRGLKGFNENGKAIFLQTTINRYLFDLEFIYLASKKRNNIHIQPIEVDLGENVKFSKMKAGVLMNEGANFIKIFFRSLLGLK